MRGQLLKDLTDAHWMTGIDLFLEAGGEIAAPPDDRKRAWGYLKLARPDQLDFLKRFLPHRIRLVPSGLSNPKVERRLLMDGKLANNSRGVACMVKILFPHNVLEKVLRPILTDRPSKYLVCVRASLDKLEELPCQTSKPASTESLPF